MSAKCPNNPTIEQFGQHVSDLLIDWLGIKGNSPGEPAGFYFLLLKSLPDVETGKMFTLRSWLSDRMTDSDPILSEPSTFVEKFILRATNLGLASNPGAVNVTGGPKGNGNNCKFCTSFICQFGNSSSKCIVFNKYAPRPAGSRDGQWKFVLDCRKYLGLQVS